MIAQEKLEEILSLHLKSQKLRKEQDWLLPKTATVRHSTAIGRRLGYREGQPRTERGRVYVHYWLPQRTVFREKPVEIQGEKFYIEIKGYGFNGGHLHGCHHDEGDLHFGMYHDIAKKEYETIRIAEEIEREEGIRSQRAISLLIFSKEEFTYQALRNLARHLIRRDTLPERKANRRQRTMNKYGRRETELAKNLFRLYKKEGKKALIKELICLRWRISDKFFTEFDTMRGEAGYLVRASRSPLRLAYSQDINSWNTDCKLTSQELNQTAMQAGRMYRRLLDRKILHQVPSAGNITLAGELMDFEDADRIENHPEIIRSWTFMAEQYKNEIKIETLRDYLALTLGERFLEDFSNPFLEGTGLGKTPMEAADAIIQLHRQSLEGLVDKRLLL
jgi:hypothetical protein